MTKKDSRKKKKSRMTNTRTNKITSSTIETKNQDAVNSVSSGIDKKVTSSRLSKVLSDPQKVNQIIAVLLGLSAIAGFISLGFYYIPNFVAYNSPEEVAKRKIVEQQKSEEDAKRKEQSKQDDLAKRLEEENKVLTFSDKSVSLKTNFGDLVVDLKDKAAPKAVENFVRLTYRGYYNNSIFHRMVKEPNFEVIQGGDPTGTGKGGESSFGSEFADEIWRVKPEFDGSGAGKIVNNPQFNDANLYQNFDPNAGTVVYPKGTLIMANKGPDTNSSQFFITLDATTLQPQYTAFGVVRQESYEVLDKIENEVNPVVIQQTPNQGQDGAPDKEIKINSAEIIS